MNDLRTAAQQALAFTMRDFASLRDFKAAKAVLHDNLRTALAQQDEPAQKQDAELSAALGWPGGISNPVLDRKVLLQKVAALMQDKLWEDHRVRHLWDHTLAQQAEPVEPVAWAFRHSDGTYHDPSVTEHSAGMVPLYPPPPQRKPLPKHDQHCVDVPGYGLMAVRLVRAVERALEEEKNRGR